MSPLLTHPPYRVVNYLATTLHEVALSISRADRRFFWINLPHTIRRYDAVIKFLERNDLLGVIRGHEAQDAGYVQ
jgi:hypothetical protein